MGVMELHAYLQSNPTPTPYLLDVREPWEFEKCHLAGSTLVPMRQIPQAMLELNQDQEIVVICHHGIRSRAVAAYLANNDFSQVINLAGGIDEWAKRVDPAMPTY